MEFVETVKVVDPSSGRLCKLFLGEDEVNRLLTIAVGTLLMHGIVHLKEQTEGTYILQEADSENPTVGH